MNACARRERPLRAPPFLGTIVIMNAITTQGEVALFRAVINLAISDAMPRARRHGGRPVLSAQRRRDMEAAREWLLGMSRDFRTVCDLALFEPLAVKAAAEKAIAAFDASAGQEAQPEMGEARVRRTISGTDSGERTGCHGA